LEDENWYVRGATTWALVKINPDWRKSKEAKEKVPEFISALKDENPYVRSAAAWALGAMKDSRAVETLISALKDENPYVREAAAKALDKVKNT